ncbi:D-glycero-D-manno-heptose 1-phosphate guanosyltransferase [Lysobacter helvus]|uniref:D-glycero-D-manno-heptose 1-phosphate guanosyltransferase n=2 Tax=Lysobacteraceae TaxID=32033 RepID=A0ABN6FR31_9GAMM|nr:MULTISPECIES: sugar phosphate nucleotidyltransferase [Lysobacter]BCT91854.1 D-glycero-D-manno-heptose 1-phosphate guanosyltransferase [Lysobacter caseinilyticus]BCT95007.1 D-glycero-D-manno-heptose 1-phosphate guanosyltransferase [Lysobacter helvus]
MPTDEAIVLVGGLGTRLRSVVSDVPKPLAPVAGRPFLAWVLDHLVDAGLARIILAVGYRGELVEQAIGARWRTASGASADIVYARESEPLGTGGAVRNAAAQLAGDAVHVVNGDTFLRYSPAALERATREAAAMLGIALAHVPDAARYGAVVIEDDLVRGFQEKGRGGPGWINAGCYFLAPAALAALPADPVFSFEEAVLAPAAQTGRVAAHTQTEGFIDIGVPDDYLRAQSLFASERA